MVLSIFWVSLLKYMKQFLRFRSPYAGVSIPPSPLVAHDCGYPLSRYTCRATRVAADFLNFRAFCRCSTGVALHPLKILVSHLPPLCREVSHRNLGLKRCRATRGCRSYSCECRDKLRGQKTAQEKKQIPGNGGSQELFGPMFP